MYISQNCDLSSLTSSSKISLNSLIYLIIHNADIIATNTTNSDGPLWNTLQRIIFSDNLLCQLYSAFRKSNTKNLDFKWPLGSLSNMKKADYIIRKFLRSPPSYNMDAIMNVALTLPAEHFGFAMHSPYSGVYIDLVRKTTLGTYEPVIVVTDNFGQKNCSLQTFPEQLYAKSTKPNYITYISNNVVVYNTKHSSYIRIILAMQVLCTTSGVIVFVQHGKRPLQNVCCTRYSWRRLPNDFTK